jgi:hypothetical protein
MRYRISTVEKKSVTQREIWTKDGQEAVYEIGWRWGSVIVNEKPDLSNYDPVVGIDPISEWDAEIDCFSDGCWSEWEYPDDMTEEEQEEFDTAYDEESDDGIMALGWDQYDTEYRFTGELEVEELED